MRCRNCGWENNLGALKCEKCNAPLSGSMVERPSLSANKYVEAPEEELKKTVRESSSNDAGILVKCNSCGYLYNSDTSNCPNCGDAQVKAEKSPLDNNHANMQHNEKLIECPNCHKRVPAKYSFCANCGKPFKMGTINPWAKPQNGALCSLTPIAWEEEEKIPEAINYTGNSIVLNRDNTDPNNNSITSREQAVLTYEDGAWYIEDKSQLQTTYLHIAKKTKLEDGAVIILGNRRFIFKG